MCECSLQDVLFNFMEFMKNAGDGIYDVINVPVLTGLKNKVRYWRNSLTNNVTCSLCRENHASIEIPSIFGQKYQQKFFS